MCVSVPVSLNRLYMVPGDRLLRVHCLILAYRVYVLVKCVKMKADDVKYIISNNESYMDNIARLL